MEWVAKLTQNKKPYTTDKGIQKRRMILKEMVSFTFYQRNKVLLVWGSFRSKRSRVGGG